MAPFEQDAPPVGEEVHMPEPSMLPIVNAVGVTLAIVGLTLELAITITGLITSVQRKITRKGDTWAVVTIEDLDGAIDVLLFPGTYQLAGSLLAEDAIVTVRGKLSRSKDQPEIRVVHLARLLRWNAYRPLIPENPVRFDQTWLPFEAFSRAMKMSSRPFGGSEAPPKLTASVTSPVM